ncbi:MAG: APC family permease, partial [Terriglobia bacterium]
KEIATVSGVAFTLIFFGIFTVSEKYSRRGRENAAQSALDQFNLEAGESLSPSTVRVRPGNVLVLVRDYNVLYHLSSVLDNVSPERQDVVVLHIRILMRGGSGEHDLVPQQLFTFNEQELFTRALNLAERHGKTIHLAVVAANEVWDGILRSAQGLQSSVVVLGLSPKMAYAEEARLAGAAWERLPEPKPQLTLEIHSPFGGEHISYLGPHAPRLTRKEVDLLHSIWLQFSEELAPEEVHHHDIVHFALNELQGQLDAGKHDEVLARLREHLEEIRKRTVPHL